MWHVGVCMEKDWAEDLGSKPKLCMLNSVCVHRFGGRCWKVREKRHRRALVILRGGTAPFQIETGRCKGYQRSSDKATGISKTRHYFPKADTFLVRHARHIGYALNFPVHWDGHVMYPE